MVKKHYSLTEQYPLGSPLEEQEVLAYLSQCCNLWEQYEGLSAQRKEEFLKFCIGARGLKVCYDPVFRFIMNPEKHPERLSEFISVVLGQRVSVKQVLPREGERLCEDGSLVIMDIVVELEDGSLANVEIQKLGYAFPGPRAACYSSDLVLRQYSRIRDERKKEFSYRDLKTVYTIIIMEESTRVIRGPGEKGAYIHRAKQRFDTGININLLQEYTFICLDSYKNMIHNKNIRTPLEAWLGFLSYDDPGRIWQILSRFPRFRPMYEELADFRQSIKEVLSMFSKELAIMDRNTVKYMMDEDKAEINRLKEEHNRLENEKIRLQEETKEAERQREEAERQREQAERQREQAERQREQAERQREEAERQRKQAENKIREQEEIIQRLMKKNNDEQ